MVLALGLTIAMPARADVHMVHVRSGDVEANDHATESAPARQARRERIGGTALTVIGALNATLSLATIGAYVLQPPCGPRCGVSDLSLGGVFLASGLVAVPALAIGITLRRMGDNDTFAAAQALPDTFFVERAARRRRTGKTLAIVGGLLAISGIGFGAGAWRALEDYNDRNQLDTMAVLSSTTGIVGVALLAVGTTMYLAGR